MDKDPRKRSTKYSQEVSVSFSKIVFDFAQTQFVIDDHYIGEPPEIQVSIENLNDNIDEKFLSNELRKMGELRSVEILKHPQTKAHLGMAKVQFISKRSAQACVETYNGKQLMGRRLFVYKDVKFLIIEDNKKEKLNPVSTPPVVPSSRCRLEDRIAVLMRQPNCVLSAIVGPQQPPPQAILTPPISVSSRRETKNYYDRSQHMDVAEADDRAWNPPKVEPIIPDIPPPPIPTPPPPEEPKPEKIILTEDQLNECMFYGCMKFSEDLKNVLFNQAKRKLIIQSHGYRYVDKLQEEHRADQARLKIEQELEKKRLQQEAEARRRLIYEENKRMEHQFVGKDSMENRMAPKPRAIRIRTGRETFREDSMQDLRRVNRSSAFVSDQRSDSRMSGDSASSSLSSSRSVSSVSSDESSSDSESSISSSASQSSLSSMSYRSSFGSATPPKPSSPIPSNILTETRKDVHLDSAWNNLDILATAATLPQSSKIEPEHEVKPISKKRKREAKLEERPVKRKLKLEVKTKEEKIQPDIKEDKDRGTAMHHALSEEEIEAFITDIQNISKEDIEFCKAVLREWQMQRQAHDVPVPFGSDAANLAHIEAREQMIDFKKNADKDPRWWFGCSRCDIINMNEKKKNEVIETAKHEDLQKALIESHVIQATLSTKRDLRCDQRRIAALNPDIDPAFLKQFTANTLQVR